MNFYWVLFMLMSLLAGKTVMGLGAVCHLNSEGGVSLCVITRLLLSEGQTPF